MTEIIGKSKEVLKETEKKHLFALEQAGSSSEIISSSAPENQETAELLQKEIRAMNENIHYMALQQMLGNIDPEKEGQEEMKQFAIVVNHVTGITLGIMNIALFIYTAVKMLTNM